MGETCIGAGGWAYFNLPNLSSLRAYSKAFDYVEVNSTFYEIPALDEARRWRGSVPESFRFSVRAHRSITHGQPFEDSAAVREGLAKMLEICRILKAEVLHFQLPPSIKIDELLAQAISRHLDSIAAGRLILALESRGDPPLSACPEMVRLMQDRGVVHSVDLLKGETPAHEADILYSRLFGKGYHNLYQPKDDELVHLNDFASGFSRAYLTFHGARMYSDAARMKAYTKTGIFPRITKSVGLDSLREILAEDARFPSTKAELLHDQGWKLFENDPSGRARVGDVLGKLPEGTYGSLEDVLRVAKGGGDLHG